MFQKDLWNALKDQKFHREHCKVSDGNLVGHIVWINSGCKLNEELGLQKPKTATWVFSAPCLPIFPFLHSFMHHRAFKLDLDEELHEPILFLLIAF